MCIRPQPSVRGVTALGCCAVCGGGFMGLNPKRRLPTMDWSEPQGDERLWRAAKRHLLTRPMGQPEAGDVLLFRMRDGAVAKHLGIASEQGFIHSYSGHGVIESALTKPWRRRIAARFAFPKEIQ